jgi:hypothetical protein
MQKSAKNCKKPEIVSFGFRVSRSAPPGGIGWNRLERVDDERCMMIDGGQEKERLIWWGETPGEPQHA